MKKILTLAAVIVFVFTLAAATYAVEFKASGMIRVRTAWYMNTDGSPRVDDDNFNDTEAWVDSRFRLKMDLVASEDLMGVVYFEGDSTRWGENRGTGAQRNQAGSWGAGGSDAAAVELKQFYIDFNVPGLKDTAPTNVRVGTQWLAIRSHVFLGADGATLRIFTNPGPVRLYLNWSKPYEGTDHQYDDADLYSTRVVLALPDFPVQPGGFFAYLHSNDYGNEQGMNSGARLGSGNFWWLGVNVDGKIGPANLKTDFVYFNGEVDASSAALAAGTNFDADYGGWLVYADVNVPIAQFTVGGTFMYATGDDVDEYVKTKPDLGAYRIPPGSEANPALGVVFWASGVNDAVDIATGEGGAQSYAVANANRAQSWRVQQRWFGGLWTAKGYASFKPLDWLKVTGYGMYIGDTTKEGNTIGNAVETATTLEDEDYIGLEFGAIVDLNIYKNLTYSVGAGYLLAGDALDTYTGVGLVNDDPDDPWAIVSQLIYKF
jgi:hypothetical protein